MIYSLIRLKGRPQFEYELKNQDDLKKQDDLKNEDNIKNEMALKNEDDIKNEDDTKMSTASTTLPEKFVDDSTV